jgi:Flp pilus assembly pilin Flp
MIRKIWRDERGQDMVEYALIGAFVATAAVSLSPAIYAVASYFSHSLQLLFVALQNTWSS